MRAWRTDNMMVISTEDPVSPSWPWERTKWNDVIWKLWTQFVRKKHDTSLANFSCDFSRFLSVIKHPCEILQYEISDFQPGDICKVKKKRPTSVNIPLGNIGEHRDQSIMVRFHHGSAHGTNDTDHVHRPRSKASRMFLQYFFCNMASLLHAWLHFRQAEITLMTAPAITHPAMDSHWRTRWGSQCPPLSTLFILVKKHESRLSYILGICSPHPPKTTLSFHKG